MNDEPAALLCQLLAAAGFTREAAGRLVRGPLLCTVDADWAELSRPSGSVPLAGFWRSMPHTGRDVCELPLWLLRETVEVPPDLGTLLQWALGAAPAVPAAADWVQRLDPSRMSVAAGRVLTIAADAAKGRLTLPLARVRSTAPDHAAATRQLADVAAAARFCRSEAGSPAGWMTVYIDLRETPADWIEPLARLGVEVLRNIARTHAATFDFLLDPAMPTGA